MADYLVRADGCPGLPDWLKRKLVTWKPSPPLTVVDVWDDGLPVLVRHRKEREAAYVRAGWPRFGSAADVCALRPFIERRLTREYR